MGHHSANRSRFGRKPHAPAYNVEATSVRPEKLELLVSASTLKTCGFTSPDASELAAQSRA